MSTVLRSRYPPFCSLIMSVETNLKMDNQSHGHNSSVQHHVQKNHDSALDLANEHVHGHLHHTAHAEQGRRETEYSKETTHEKSNIPDQGLHDQSIHLRHPPAKPATSSAIADTEKGEFGRDSSSEVDPRTHTLSNFYLKYRIFFHLFIWLLFTGFVCSLPMSIRVIMIFSKLQRHVCAFS